MSTVATINFVYTCGHHEKRNAMPWDFAPCFPESGYCPVCREHRGVEYAVPGLGGLARYLQCTLRCGHVFTSRVALDEHNEEIVYVGRMVFCRQCKNVQPIVSIDPPQMEVFAADHGLSIVLDARAGAWCVHVGGHQSYTYKTLRQASDRLREMLRIRGG